MTTTLLERDPKRNVADHIPINRQYVEDQSLRIGAIESIKTVEYPGAFDDFSAKSKGSFASRLEIKGFLN